MIASSVASRWKYRSGLLFLLTSIVAIASAIFTTIRRFDPFPVLEFQNASGEIASTRIPNWRFGPTDAIRRVSHKSASSIDSYSSWTVFDVTSGNAEVLIDQVHRKMANLGNYTLSQYVCEQRSKQIKEIVIEDSTGAAPKWWASPSGSGKATENMLWDRDPTFGGTARGCYSIYDTKTHRLWVYEFAAQEVKLWTRGSEAGPVAAPED